VRPAARLVLAGLPGAVLALVSLLGWGPAERDLMTYFVPLRARTADVLTGARGPFWDPDVGCGEPFFANPQSALLYPPAWLAAVLPPTTAVGVEGGLHLALLAVGCALLARRLGASRWLEVAAGWSVVVAGPILDAVGVLNNLDALAWMPLVWWAALEGRLVLAAAFTAACYLAAEPQLAAVAGVVALTLTPRRRTLAALVLAVGIVGVQAVPFASWVREGNRGRPEEGRGALAGVVLAGELPALAVPGAPLPERVGGRFVAHFTLPLWAIVMALFALADRRAEVRTLALWSVSLMAFSVIPSFGWGLKLWNVATFGMVRFPGRLLFPAIVAMVPAAAAAVGERHVPRWVAAAFAVGVTVFGVLIGGLPWAVALVAVSAGAVMASLCAAPAALAGAAALAPLAVGALAMAPARPLPPPLCAGAQRSTGRVYVVAPSWAQFSWAGQERLRRMVGLGWGYAPLLDGRRMVRTFAPLEARTLETHISEADRGPSGRWWLNSLAADRVVAQHPMPGFPLLCEEEGLRVFANPGAWPETAIVCAVPRPGETPVPCGEVVADERGDDLRRWRVRAGVTGGVLMWQETPDPGWRMQVDGHAASAVHGVGILHGVAVPPGDHEVTARYLPPHLLGGALLSFVSVCVLGVAAWRRW
jgi:hypothetical protein